MAVLVDEQPADVEEVRSEQRIHEAAVRNQVSV